MEVNIDNPLNQKVKVKWPKNWVVNIDDPLNQRPKIKWSKSWVIWRCRRCKKRYVFRLKFIPTKHDPLAQRPQYICDKCYTLKNILKGRKDER